MLSVILWLSLIPAAFANVIEDPTKLAIPSNFEQCDNLKALYPESLRVPDNAFLEATVGSLTGFADFSRTDTFLRFMERVRKAGVTIPISPGIMPVSNFKGLQRMADPCGIPLPGWLGNLFEGLDNDPETRRLIACSIAAETCAKLAEEGADIEVRPFTHHAIAFEHEHDDEWKVDVASGRWQVAPHAGVCAGKPSFDNHGGLCVVNHVGRKREVWKRRLVLVQQVRHTVMPVPDLAGGHNLVARMREGADAALELLGVLGGDVLDHDGVARRLERRVRCGHAERLLPGARFRNGGCRAGPGVSIFTHLQLHS